VELVSRRDEFQLELFLQLRRRGKLKRDVAKWKWNSSLGETSCKIEVQLVSPRDEFQLELVCPTDEKAISLKCFETVFSCKIVLKIILLNKKNLKRR
jgi:hypothetical protein